MQFSVTLETLMVITMGYECYGIGNKQPANGVTDFKRIIALDKDGR